eukprot:g960.t1
MFAESCGPYGGAENAREIKRVFLTGGSGYLGRNLIRFFVENGVEVHAIARSEKSERIVKHLGAVPFRADLLDIDGMMRAADGCDTTIHSAAFVKVWGNLEEARTITVEGTRNVLRVSKDTPSIDRVIHVGTEAGCIPYYDGSALKNLTEETPLPERPFPGIYSTTKNEAEKVALSFQDAAGNLDVVSVRPRLIWGRDDTVFLPSMVEATKSGVLQWFDGGEYYTSTCHVENVVEGIVRAAVSDGHVVGGRPFFLTDGAPVQFKWFVTELLRASGVAPPTSSVPMSLVWYVAHAAEIYCSYFDMFGLCKDGPFVTRQALALVAQEMTVDDAAAYHEMGYQGRMTMKRGLDEIRSGIWSPDYVPNVADELSSSTHPEL